MVALQTILPVSVYFEDITVGKWSALTSALTAWLPNLTIAAVVPSGAYQFRFTLDWVSPGCSVRYSVVTEEDVNGITFCSANAGTLCEQVIAARSVRAAIFFNLFFINLSLSVSIIFNDMVVTLTGRCKN